MGSQLQYKGSDLVKFMQGAVEDKFMSTGSATKLANSPKKPNKETEGKGTVHTGCILALKNC